MEFEVRKFELVPIRGWYPTATFQDNSCNQEQLQSASPVRHWRFLRGSGPDDAFINLTVPFWLPMLMMVAGAALPWLPWWRKRFSLRTLLIAITLVAMVLGLAVYLGQ